MNPRTLKGLLKTGGAGANWNKIPYPPEEWGRFRRLRLEIAIQCALMYFRNDYDYAKIAAVMSRKKWQVKDKLTKQRISQYVAKGMLFLIDHGVMWREKGENNANTAA
jgi:hypothetical protein